MHLISVAPHLPPSSARVRRDGARYYKLRFLEICLHCRREWLPVPTMLWAD